MTTYGTIPTSQLSSTSSPLHYFSRTNGADYSALDTPCPPSPPRPPRPWHELTDIHSFSLPPCSFRPLLTRIKSNLTYFTKNYVFIVLLVVLLSLMLNKVSFNVFLVCMIAWFYFYLLRDEPLELCGDTIGETVVLVVLSILTLVVLLLTHATVNILVSLPIGIVVVLLHAAVRPEG